MPSLRVSKKHSLRSSLSVEGLNYQLPITNYKLLFVFILFFSLITHHSSLTHAATPLEKAQQDYTFQFTKYRESQEEYTTARSAYLTYKTAAAKNNAYLTTRGYLSQIDELYFSYIALVTEYGNSIDWEKTSLSKDKINALQNNEVFYLKNHQQKVLQASTFEELPPLSQELKKHLETDLIPKINIILATLEVAQVESTFNDLLKLSKEVEEKIAARSESGEVNTILTNWSSEVNNIENSIQSLKDQSLQKLNLASDETFKQGDLEEIVKLCNEAKTQLKKSKPLFEEVIKFL